MRPAVVLLILAAGLLALIFVRHEQETDFDTRYDRAEDRIRALAEDIDDDLDEAK